MFGFNSHNQKKIADLLKAQSDFNFNKAGVKNRLLASIRDAKLNPAPAPFKSNRRWLFQLSGVLAALVLLVTSLTYANAAKPGDKLYFLDLFEEKVQVNIPRSTAGQAELQSKLINERLEEINRIPTTDAKSATLKTETIKNVQQKLIQAVDDTAAAKVKLEQKGKLDSVEKVNTVLDNLEKTAGEEEDRMEKSKTDSQDSTDSSQDKTEQAKDWQIRIDAIKKARLKARLEVHGNSDDSTDDQDKTTEPTPEVKPDTSGSGTNLVPDLLNNLNNNSGKN